MDNNGNNNGSNGGAAKLEHVRFPGIRGRWYEVDRCVMRGVEFIQFEEEHMGDEWPGTIAAAATLQVVVANAWNGFDDLEEALDNDAVRIMPDGRIESEVA